MNTTAQHPDPGLALFERLKARYSCPVTRATIDEFIAARRADLDAARRLQPSLLPPLPCKR